MGIGAKVCFTWLDLWDPEVIKADGGQSVDSFIETRKGLTWKPDPYRSLRLDFVCLEQIDSESF